jgi:hypothetical protein
MRYTRIDLEGDTRRFASITRKRESGFIDVEIIAPDGTTNLRVGADDGVDQWSLAQRLRSTLETSPDAGRTLTDYFTAIRNLAD